MQLHAKTADKELRSLIKRQAILFAGNSKLKIYGRLNCSSGRRMNKENRVFFESAEEAIKLGFRPCGHCMRNEYKRWKNEFI